MPLFYGQNSWINKLTGAEDAAKKQRLFPQKPGLPLPVPQVSSVNKDSHGEDDDLINEMPYNPNIKKSISSKLFPEEPKASRISEEVLNSPYFKGFTDDSPYAGMTANDYRTSLGKPEEPKKIGFLKNLGLSFVDKFLPGFADRAVGTQKDSRSAFQKDLEYFQGLDPQAQDSALKFKSAGSMNPLAISRFDLEKQRFERDADKIAHDRQKDDLAIAVPGYERTGETRIGDTEAAKLRSAVGELGNLGSGFENLKKMYDKYGNTAIPGTKASQELGASHAALQMALKEAENLGALTGPDLGLLEKQLMAPNSLKSLYTPAESSKAQIDELYRNLQNRVKEKMGASGYAPKASQRKREAEEWLRANPNDPRAEKIRQKLQGMQ